MKTYSQINEVYNLIERIDKERKRQGLSYRDLAELCGYKREQMNQVAVVFGHKVVPRIDTLLKLMKPLGLTLVITLEDTEE